MQDKRYIICGNAPTSGIENNPDRDLRLRLWGKDGPDKITLRIEDIHKKMSKDVPDSFQDLLEIATYVYSADQAIPRGADNVDSFGHGWRRNLHFIIPVRNPDFWNGEEIQQALCSTLGFLSDDSYHFVFTKLTEAQAFQGYLDFNDDGRLLGYPAILRWMIEGCLDWRENGLLRPESVKEATAAYFDEQDLFGQWIEECCNVGPRLVCKTAELFESWKGFAERNGEHPGSTKAFSANLCKREFIPGRTKTSRHFTGICLKKREEWQDAYDR